MMTMGDRCRSSRLSAASQQLLLGLALGLLQTAAAQAQLSPAPQVGPRSPAEIRAGDAITGSVEAAVGGDAAGALALADQAVAEDADDPWGRSIAIWAQADALKEAGRCDEASPIYLRYAQYVEARDPEAAAMGRRYALKHCVPLRK